jgi:hypothetical protein
MDGLRGLTFLGGSPGTGKTSLALWVAFDAARANPDTVVVFVTCEMSAKEVQASLITQRAVILFDHLMKGRPGQQPAANGMMLPPGDIANLEKARRDIAALGDRWRISAVHSSGRSAAARACSHPSPQWRTGRSRPAARSGCWWWWTASSASPWRNPYPAA